MDTPPISPEDGSALLKLARATVEAHVLGRPLPTAPDPNQRPFGELRGLFVTLHVAGQLRGCMGTFHPDRPLGELVREMTLTSLGDPRFVFDRIGPRDLARLNIEISVLSPLRLSRDPLAEFQVGVHGVLVRLGGRSGCFLPQVATEMGWGGQEMLDQCCAHKAGLADSAWRRPEAEVYLFTAQIFQEPECHES